jgi:hypothetical protein
MANQFKVNSLILSQQNLVATGNVLYLNSVDVTASSGQANWLAANNNAINLSGNAAITGATLITDINNVSGYANRKAIMDIQFTVGTTTWTAMTNTRGFFNGSSSYITQVDLLQYTGVKLIVNQGVAGTVSGSIHLGYLGNFSPVPSAYLPIDTNATRTRIGVLNTIANSGWQPLAAGARSGVYIALLGSSGNAILSPTFGMITAYFQ